MNENIDLTKILKDCPIGWKFYSSMYGDVTFKGIENDSEYPVKFHLVDIDNLEKYGSVTEQGFFASCYKGECTLFPSYEQRDWSKFTAPWYKKEKFDPKTLNPFDRVLVKCASIYNSNLVWRVGLFSYFHVEDDSIRVYTLGSDDNTPNLYVIPYNDNTKHLVNTTEDAPEYYRYWED